MRICEVRSVLTLLIAVPPMISYVTGLALCESDSIMVYIVASRGGSGVQMADIVGGGHHRQLKKGLVD